MSVIRQSRTFDLGGVITNTFRIISKGWVVMVPLALFFAVLQVGLSWAYGYYFPFGPGSGGAFEAMLASAGLWLATMVLGLVATAALVKGAGDAMSGSDITIASAIMAVGGRLLPLLGLTVVISIGVGVGLVLLVVPGLFLLSLWAVATPACVLENRGVGKSLERSAQLTEGKRWWVLLALMIWWVTITVFTMLFTMATFPFIPDGGLTVDVTPRFEILSALGQFVPIVVSNIVGAAGLVALHAELRYLRDGAAGPVASIFD